jgi:transketolase
MTTASQTDLVAVGKRVRRHIVEMTHAAQSGHPGGSLSSVEILTALYFGGILRHDPQRPQWPDRDRLIMSKGHATPVVYGVLAEAGYIDTSELTTFRQLGSTLQGHVIRGKPPGVEMNAGALGLGLSFANGLALAHRLDGRDARTYCLLGDGELNEGQNWEAAMSAAHFGFDSITAIVDRNGYQNDDIPGDEVMNLNPLADKWEAFGWHVIEVADGHDAEAMVDAYEAARAISGQPQVIIARTQKGKGVSFMEGSGGWHGKAPNDEQLAQALKEIG